MRGVPTDIGTIHFVGIGGIGMSGIAEVMANRAKLVLAEAEVPKAMADAFRRGNLYIDGAPPDSTGQGLG